MLNVKKMRKGYEIILLFTMLLASGTPFQKQYNIQVVLAYFLLAMVYFFIFGKSRINCVILAQIGVYGAALILTMISNRDKDIGHYLGVFCTLIATGCVVSIMSFERFRSLFIGFIVVISTYSVIITVFSNINPSYPGVLPTIEVETLKWKHIGIFYYYWGWHPWMSFIRNSACFREPGVWGCYAVLALNILISSTEKYSKKDIKKIICIIVGIISSVSTTAILGLILCLVFYFLQTNKLTKKQMMLFLYSIIVIWFVVNNYGERLFGKLRSTSSSYNSFTERVTGMLGGLNHFLNNPFWGNGYTNYLSDIQGTSANSYIDILGKYGFIFSVIVFIGLFLWILHSAHKVICRVVIAFLLLVTLGTQNLILYPIFLTLSFYGYKFISIENSRRGWKLHDRCEKKGNECYSSCV